MILSTEHFNYDMNKRMLVQEISSLPNFRFKNIGNDKGITVISAHSAKKVNFAIHKVDSNEDGIQGWRLIPTRNEIKKNPKLHGLSVLIIND